MDKSDPLVKIHMTIVGGEKGGDDAYHKDFTDRCMSVEGNTKDVCEYATA